MGKIYNEHDIEIIMHSRGSRAYDEAGGPVIEVAFPHGGTERLSLKAAERIAGATTYFAPKDENPFPLRGYVNQNADNAALANEAKEMEERMMRFFDKISSVAVQREDRGAEAGKGQINMRALALARTNGEQAFMWAVRAIFNPVRISLQEDITKEAGPESVA
jgi:hypothetical protein